MNKEVREFLWQVAGAFFVLLIASPVPYLFSSLWQAAIPPESQSVMQWLIWGFTGCVIGVFAGRLRK